MSDRARLVSGLGVIGLGLGLIAGWVLNIIAIIGAAGGGITAELIVRLVGVVVVPLGALLGYIF